MKMLNKNNNKVKIIITGASGFLGKSLIRQLSEKEYQVFPVLHSECDLTNINDCISQIKNADVILHLAGLVVSRMEQQKRPAEVLFQNLVGTANIFEAARKNNIPRVITINSITAYPEFALVPLREKDIWGGLPSAANIEYGLAKRMAVLMGEAYGKQFGLTSCSLILPNLYGVGDKISYNPPPLIPNIIMQLSQAKRQNLKEFFAGDNGQNKLDIMYVDDAARIIIKLLKFKNLPKILNASTAKPVTVRHLVDIVAKQVNFKGKIIWGKSAKQSVRSLNISEFKKLFGNFKMTDIETGLKRTVLWYKGLEK